MLAPGVHFGALGNNRVTSTLLRCVGDNAFADDYDEREQRPIDRRRSVGTRPPNSARSRLLIRAIIN